MDFDIVIMMIFTFWLWPEVVATMDRSVDKGVQSMDFDIVTLWLPLDFDQKL